MAGIIKVVAAIGLLVVAAACSGTPTTQTQAPTGTSGATNPPGTSAAPPPTGVVTQPPATQPPATQPPGGGNECAVFPSFNPLASATPAILRDPTLEARFPTQIDGQPVTELQSFYWAQLVCMGGQASFDSLRSQLPSIDLAALTMATAKATVNGDEVELVAFRLPGGDANVIVNAFAQLAAAAGEDSDIASVVPGTAAGKPVVVVTDDSGVVSYGYVSGDTLFFAEDIDQSQADKIFAAFQ